MQQMQKHMMNVTNDEGLLMEDLKKMLHALNDIRVLLNSIFAREYIFECLRQDKKLQTGSSSDPNAIGIDLIKGFLAAVVTILIESNSPSGVSILTSIQSRTQVSTSYFTILKLSQQVSQAARLVLNQFIETDSLQTRQTETQRIM